MPPKKTKLNTKRKSEKSIEKMVYESFHDTVEEVEDHEDEDVQEIDFIFMNEQIKKK